MAKVKVSEKMQRAVRKLQSRIGSPNQQYQNLSSDESSPRSGSYLMRGRSFLSRSGRFSSCSDLESDDENSKSPPSDVPEGFLAVYVGQERQRFVINADYLKHQMFKALLEKSAEEYGFGHQGGLPIACEVTYFEHLLWSLQTKDPSLRRTDVNASLQEGAVKELLDCGCVQSESRKLPFTSVRLLACVCCCGSTVTKSVTGIYRF